jgi:catechol-2,3-dioxygenase
MKNYPLFLPALIFLLILNPFKITPTPMQAQSTPSKSGHNGGIVFFKAHDPDTLESFYTETIGCTLWLDQGACKIFQHGNMLFGFCRADEKDQQGVITFFYPERSQVDQMYRTLQEIALGAPKMNEKFNIYHFYARDPEGRSIEFQYFNHPLKSY